MERANSADNGISSESAGTTPLKMLRLFKKKPMKATKLEKPYIPARENCSDAVHNHTAFMTEPIRLVDVAKKEGGWNIFETWISREIQALMDTAPEDRRWPDADEALKPEPDWREEMQ